MNLSSPYSVPECCILYEQPCNKWPGFINYSFPSFLLSYLIRNQREGRRLVPAKHFALDSKLLAEFLVGIWLAYAESWRQPWVSMPQAMCKASTSGNARRSCRAENWSAPQKGLRSWKSSTECGESPKLFLTAVRGGDARTAKA